MQTSTRPVNGYLTSSPGAMESSTGCAAWAADAKDFFCAAVEREVAEKITANAHNDIAAVFIGRENSKIGSANRGVFAVIGDSRDERRNAQQSGKSQVSLKGLWEGLRQVFGIVIFR